MVYKDPEAKRAYDKKYYQENKKKAKARAKKRYEENPEKILAKAKKDYEENPEKFRARSKKYKEENPEKVKKYKEENPEKILADQKKWREKNPEKNLANVKKYVEDMRTTEPSVVYMIECKATNKYYIGQTSLWFTQRITKHKSEFNKNKNTCGVGMQDDYNKYGPDAFEYSILKELDPQAPEEELLIEEKNYINEFLKEGKQLYNKHI